MEAQCDNTAHWQQRQHRSSQRARDQKVGEWQDKGTEEAASCRCCGPGSHRGHNKGTGSFQNSTLGGKTSKKQTTHTCFRKTVSAPEKMQGGFIRVRYPAQLHPTLSLQLLPRPVATCPQAGVGPAGSSGPQVTTREGPRPPGRDCTPFPPHSPQEVHTLWSALVTSVLKCALKSQVCVNLWLSWGGGQKKKKRLEEINL